MNARYESAKEVYAKLGIDTEAALAKLQNTRISMHCWQADDVHGFEGTGALSGGIQTTGNYPGLPRTPDEVFADLDKALSLIPGSHKINVHANYAIAEPGEVIDRDTIEPRHFKRWVEFAKAHNCGLDFNPTFFSHPKAAGLTLTSPDEDIRNFWIRHGIACIRISEYFARETGFPCLMNIWIGDGFKDVPADRMGPRMRYMDSIDKILSCGYDKSLVYVALESKVFGIGVEAYTAGSAEFTLSYAMSRHLTPLMDNGHYHPTEVVSDKIPALLCFNDRIALHITRGIRWDSDHVVAYDDETKEMMKEVVRCNALDRVFLATDYFDASINRVAAWAVGMRNARKAILSACLAPASIRDAEHKGDLTSRLALMEERKTLPFGAIWDYYCMKQDAGVGTDWLAKVKQYETDVLSKR